jgi:3-oxoacyl-[acyl-carrier protein] reductase
VVAITGTSRGLGKGLAEQLLERGYTVAGCSRGEATIGRPDLPYWHTCLDVADEAGVRAWMREIRNRYGRLDALVCNAALVPEPGFLASGTSQRVEDVFRTNVIGTFNACREAAKLMVRQRCGRIVCISSMATALHDEGTSAYAASKSAVVEMTKVLAREMAPVGVTCNVVAPSVVDTDALTALGEGFMERKQQELAIKRPVTSSEVAGVVAFLLSPESASVTGQLIYMGIVN